MKRRTPLPSDLIFQDHVSFRQGVYSERHLVAELTAYLEERFRGLFSVETLAPGDGYLLFSPDGLAYCLRQLLYPAFKLGGVRLSFFTEESRPVLTLTFAADPALTPQQLTHLVHTAASSQLLLTRPEPHVFRFYPQQTGEPAFSVYAQSDGSLLRALQRYL